MNDKEELKKLKEMYRNEPTAIEMIEAREREPKITEQDMDELRGVLEMYFVKSPTR